jgi:micrococcal nuclease
MCGLYVYKCKVTRVVDGDTVDVVLDLGFSIEYRDRVRLMAIDTPESRTRNKVEKKLGLASKGRLKDLCQYYKGGLVLRTSKEGKGKFGRILGSLFPTNGDQSLNERLIEEGYARPYYGGSKDEYGPWTKEENGQWYRWTEDGYVLIEED